MRENAITESGTFAQNTSSGGLRFHVRVKPQMLQVPDLFTFNVTSTEGESQEVIVNRYENVFVADEAYKLCCGRIILPGLGEHAKNCWTKKQPKGRATQTSAFPNNRNAGPAEEGELRPGEYVLPPEEKAVRDAYAKVVFKNLAGKIQGGMLGVPPLAAKAVPKLCGYWARSQKRK